MRSPYRTPRERYFFEDSHMGSVFVLIVLAVAQAVFLAYERWRMWRRETAGRREEKPVDDAPNG